MSGITSKNRKHPLKLNAPAAHKISKECHARNQLNPFEGALAARTVLQALITEGPRRKDKLNPKLKSVERLHSDDQNL